MGNAAHSCEGCVLSTAQAVMIGAKTQAPRKKWNAPRECTKKHEAEGLPSKNSLCRVFVAKVSRKRVRLSGLYMGNRGLAPKSCLFIVLVQVRNSIFFDVTSASSQAIPMLDIIISTSEIKACGCQNHTKRSQNSNRMLKITSKSTSNM